MKPLVTPPNLDEKTTPKKKVDEIFNIIDFDNDGRLALKEFVEGAKRDATIYLLFQSLMTNTTVKGWAGMVLYDWV